MAKFLVLYRSSVTASEQMANPDPEQMKEGMALWQKWGEKVGKALADWGAPLGDGRFLPASSAKSDGGYVGGFSVLQAQSIDEASSLLEDHPHFHAPGASIEVHEMLPMPGAEM